MLPTDLDGWLDYIGRQHSAEIVMGLDRVRTVWTRMGCPGAPLNIIVGGTNGKGSTCAMLESILHIAGYRTGFYSSPHLVRYNERVRILQQQADDDLLVASFAAVEAARTQGGTQCGTQGGNEADVVPLTYFEYATLSAFWCYAQSNLDVAILEVGMGGRLDAVNLIDADAAILVSVDLDHQAYLGDTREKIGWEKAHIFRPQHPAIYADADMPESVGQYAQQIGAHLYRLNQDFRVTRQDTQWQWHGRIGDTELARHALPMPALRGRYQLNNAAAALMALACLQSRLPVSATEVKRGLLEVEWPGRMQVLPGRPTVVLDVAHNPHAAAALADALGTMGFYENTYAVFGMLRDKDIRSVVRLLSPRIDHWFIAGLDGPRVTTAAQLGALLEEEGLAGRYTPCVSITHALAAAQERATPNDRILGFGSFYTVADLLRALNRR